MNLNSYLSFCLHNFHVISSISGSCGKARNYFALDLLAVFEASAFFAAFSTVFHCLLALFSVVTAASSSCSTTFPALDGAYIIGQLLLYYYCSYS
jgi:hypothetical protein